MDVQEILFAKKLAGGGGGGGGNYTDMIAGTLANPFGSLGSFAEVANLLSHGDISFAGILIDGTAIGAGEIGISGIFQANTAVVAQGFTVYDNTIESAVEVNWSYRTNTDNTIVNVWTNGSYQDLSAYASLLPTYLRVRHHPMP